ncbi:hypothetical protein GCM10027091_33630 [Streptomyces daliensis]
MRGARIVDERVNVLGQRADGLTDRSYGAGLGEVGGHGVDGDIVPQEGLAGAAESVRIASYEDQIGAP